MLYNMNNRKPLQGRFLLSNLIKIFCLSLFLFSLASLNPASAKIITIGSSTDMIGIGTSTPEARLHIVPSTGMEGLIIKASNYSPFIVKNSSNVEVFKIDQNGSITSSGSLVGSNNYWNLSGSNLYASNTSWNLGIGTTSPAGKLQVVGNTYIGSAAGGTSILYLYGNSAAGVNSSLYTTNGNLHIDSANGAYATYLNYYRGTGGVIFGNGAAGSNARVAANGEYIGYKLNINNKGRVDELGNITAESFLDISNTLYKLDPSNTGTSLNVAGSVTALGTTASNYFAGNVGIGTSPSQKLTVNGNILISPAADSRLIFGSSFTIQSPLSVGASWRRGFIGSNLYWDQASSTWQSVGSGSSDVAGISFSSGGISIIARNGYTQPRTFTTAEIDAMANITFFNNGNVSIPGLGNFSVGTTNPRAKLDVTGAVDLSGDSGLAAAVFGSSYNHWTYFGGTTSGRIRGNSGEGYLLMEAFPTGTQNDLIFRTGGNERMRVKSTGYVGIGTSGPGALLDVANKILLSSDGTMVWGSSATHGRLSWDTGKAIVYARSGNGLSLGANNAWDQLYIKSGGNVGIGTTNPLDPLHVVGNVRIGALLNCSGTGAAIKTDASGRLVCGTISGGVTGSVSGTTNYLAKWTGTNTLGNTVIYDNGTNVGIGTASPAAKLQINPQLGTEGLRIISNTNSSPLVIRNSANTADFLRVYQWGTVVAPTEIVSQYISVSPWYGDPTWAYGSLRLGNNWYYSGSELGIMEDLNGYNLITYDYDSNKLFIGSDIVDDFYTGNVGIGTVSPGAKLQINPRTGVEGLRIISSNYSPLVIRDSTNSNDYLRVYQWGLVNTPRGLSSNDISVYPGYSNSSWNYDGLYIGNHGWYSGDELGIVEQYHGYNLITHDYGAGSSGKLFVGDSITEDRGTGNVGVGTTNPVTKLDVNGSINLASSGKLGFGGVNTNWMDFTSNYFRLLMGGSGAAPLKVGGLVVSGDYGATAPTTGAYIQGNLGVGVSSPAHKLTVLGGYIDYQPVIGLYAATASGNTATRNWAFLANYATYGDFGIMQSNVRDGNPVSGTTRFYIKDNGYIGIGTTNPSANLDVVGTSVFRSIERIGQASNNPVRGSWNPLWTAIAAGRALYADEEFASSTNSVAVYNNSPTTGVQHFWENGDGSQPNASGKWIRIENNGNATSPGRGGFHQLFNCRPNATFVQRFRAKLPSGYTLEIAENSLGDNKTSYWLTSNAGTGKWEEYIRVGHCGNSGTFSNGGHVYANGGASSIFTWYLASSNVYEVGSPPGVFSGNVSIGTTSKTYKLTVGGDVGATAFNYTSDRSLKKNIKTISNPVDKIMNLRGVSFSWKDNGQASLGLIAQEVEKVFPELVTGDGLKSVQYGNLVAPLIEAVKEQQREIELLNKRIEALEARK